MGKKLSRHWQNIVPLTFNTKYIFVIGRYTKFGKPIQLGFVKIPNKLQTHLQVNILGNKTVVNNASGKVTDL